MTAVAVPARVVGAGLCVPIGDTLPAAHAAWRGGVHGFRRSKEHRSIHDGVPRTVGVVSGLDAAWPTETRIVELVRAAAAEAWADARAVVQGAAPSRVLLVLPGVRPDLQADAEAFIAAIVAALPVVVPREACRVMHGDHASGLAALARLLETAPRDADHVILAVAADSLVAPLLLDALEPAGVLKTHRTANGFIAGEGAAALVLSMTSGDSSPDVAATIRRIANEDEDRPWFEGHPVMAGGLSRAYQAALGDDMAASLWTDVNGEIWRATEHHLSYVRSGDHHVDPLLIHHPLTQTGDLGAASSLALLALASYDVALARRGAPALIATASLASSSRAACLLSHPSAETSLEDSWPQPSL
jgi:3-oxoacyl-[acyl-carrier-protein] synthase I